MSERVTQTEVSLDLQQIQNFLVAVGSGGALGIITGAALKHTARRVAIALGTVFIFLQVAQFVGFVDVRWDKVTESALPVFDANNDGVLDDRDAQIIVQESVQLLPEILMAGLPNVAGFATGMMAAFYFL